MENLGPAIQAGATLHRGDVTDPATVARAFAAVRPDVVFHLAAQIDVRRAVADPGHDARVNVTGTAVVLEQAVRSGAQRFVLASTGGAIYGDADVVPTPESAPPRPQSPYAVSKRPPSSTSSTTPACAGCRRSSCGSPTSTARARTRAARPA